MPHLTLCQACRGCSPSSDGQECGPDPPDHSSRAPGNLVRWKHRLICGTSLTRAYPPTPALYTQRTLGRGHHPAGLTQPAVPRPNEVRSPYPEHGSYRLVRHLIDFVRNRAVVRQWVQRFSEVLPQLTMEPQRLLQQVGGVVPSTAGNPFPVRSIRGHGARAQPPNVQICAHRTGKLPGNSGRMTLESLVDWD